jgi:hypothetical protein
MKIIGILLLALLVQGKAQASGCGSYDDTRTIHKNELFAVSYWNQFTVLSKTDNQVSVRDNATGAVFNLDWEKSEAYDDSSDYKQLEKRDIYFEEGNGCGPIYACITGQVKVIMSDAKTQKTETYAFPRVNEVNQSAGRLRYVSHSLLPVFGKMKLDTPSLEEMKVEEPLVNRQQCGYGYW